MNAICPGWVDTDMAWEGLDAFDGLTRERGVRRGDAGGAAAADERTRGDRGTVAWLLSPDAVGVTGQAIDHNNGAFMI